MSDFNTLSCNYDMCVHERNAVSAKPAPKVTTKRNYAYEVRDFHNNPEARRGEELGSGCYGAVYAHKYDPTLVLKEFSIVDGYPVWMAYAALAYRQGMGNSVLPRIYGVSLPDRVYSTMKGHVLMERLDCRVSDKISELPGFDDVRRKVQEFADEVLHSGSTGKPTVINTGYKRDDRFYKLSTAHLKRVAAVMSAANIGLNTDMHTNNFMLRGDAVVITDPFILEWRTDNCNRDTRLLGVITRMCKEAAAFTPGFYSEYALRREINIS